MSGINEVDDAHINLVRMFSMNCPAYCWSMPFQETGMASTKVSSAG